MLEVEAVPQSCIVYVQICLSVVFYIYIYIIFILRPQFYLQTVLLHYEKFVVLESFDLRPSNQ
jgi:hypothetical protein